MRNIRFSYVSQRELSQTTDTVESNQRGSHARGGSQEADSLTSTNPVRSKGNNHTRGGSHKRSFTVDSPHIRPAWMKDYEVPGIDQSEDPLMYFALFLQIVILKFHVV